MAMAPPMLPGDRKSTRLNSSHANISYAVFCLKKKKEKIVKGEWFYLGFYFGLVFLGIESILTIAGNRCLNTPLDCESNIEEAQLISHAAHPLIITDCNSLGSDNFFAVLNESKATKSDFLYNEGTTPKLNPFPPPTAFPS